MKVVKDTNRDDHLVVIPWSGGFDSTFLLVEELHKGNDVLPVYFNYKNIGQMKLQAERLSRKILREFISKKIMAPDALAIFHQEEIVDLGIYRNAQNDIHCPQTVLFVHQLSYIVRSRHVRDLARGRQIVVKWPFVMRDDAVSFLPEIKKLFDSVANFENEPSNVRIEFPIAHIQKTELFIRLRKRGLPVDKLISYTHTCEMPEVSVKYPFIRVKSCGVCKPCVSHKFDFNELETERRYNPGRMFLLNKGKTIHGNNPKIETIALLSSMKHTEWTIRAEETFKKIDENFASNVVSWLSESDGELTTY